MQPQDLGDYRYFSFRRIQGQLTASSPAGRFMPFYEPVPTNQRGSRNSGGLSGRGEGAGVQPSLDETRRPPKTRRKEPTALSRRFAVSLVCAHYRSNQRSDAPNGHAPVLFFRLLGFHLQVLFAVALRRQVLWRNVEGAGESLCDGLCALI